MKAALSSSLLAAAAALLPSANAYWLMGMKNLITVERVDPILTPGAISSHVHAVVGGSNFGMSVSTDKLLKSTCTSAPIPEDKSNYWFPQLYFEFKNGTFQSVGGGAVIYYLYDAVSNATAFPADFRMISGDPTLRKYDANSYAQQAVSFICLNFDGTSTRFTGLPAQACASGVRSQINFPSCWDGKNVESTDHKSHVAFRSGGPDSGSCKDPKFPVELPRIFMEVYWGTNSFNNIRSQALNPNQPFVFASGDPTGYGYHADFYNGWTPGVLQKAINGCACDIYGDPTCCAQKGIFTYTGDKTQTCYSTKSTTEQTTGTIPKLPGNNPVTN